MRRTWPVLLLCACTDTGVLTVVGGDEATEPTPSSTCDNKLAEIHPAPDQVHPADTPVELQLAAFDPLATIRIGALGAEVSGTTTRDGLWVRWNATEVVPTGTPLAMRLTWSCDVESAQWSLEAPVWRLSPVLTAAQLDAAPRLAMMSDLIVSLSGLSPELARVRVLPLDGDDVHACATSVDTELSFAAPALSATEPAPSGIVVDGQLVDARLSLSGTLAPGLTELAGLTVSTTVSPDVLVRPTPPGACDRLTEAGWPCRPCDGGRCVDMELELDATLMGVDGLPVRTEQDVADEPLCR